LPRKVNRKSLEKSLEAIDVKKWEEVRRVIISITRVRWYRKIRDRNYPLYRWEFSIRESATTLFARQNTENQTK